MQRQGFAVFSKERLVIGRALKLPALCGGDAQFGDVFVGDAEVFAILAELIFGKAVFHAQGVAADIAEQLDVVFDELIQVIIDASALVAEGEEHPVGLAADLLALFLAGLFLTRGHVPFTVNRKIRVPVVDMPHGLRIVAILESLYQACHELLLWGLEGGNAFAFDLPGAF